MIERVRSKLRLRGEAGYSLVEMLIVMMIMSIVFAGITDSVRRRLEGGGGPGSSLPGAAHDPVGARQDPPRHPLRERRDAVLRPARSRSRSRPACGGDVSWCTVAVTGYTNRYALYRQAGTTCGSSGTKIADYLTTANAFPGVRAHGRLRLSRLSPGRLRRQREGQHDVGTYDSADTIYLRNSTRI